MKIVVVFGMGPAGLFLSRQLKCQGADVIGVGKADDLGRYSNALIHYYETESRDGIALAINEVVEQYGEGVEAWICSDQYLTLFIEEYPEAFKLLNFKNPGEAILRLIAEKDTLMAYCEKIGVRFPERYSVDRMADIEYPVAVKPNIKHGESPIKKVGILKNEKELSELLSFAHKYGLEPNQLIIQKAILGDNSDEYGYGGFFENGKVVNDVFFIQMRQYPQGVCCYTLELCDEKIKQQIVAETHILVKSLNYTGFIQFDLKRNSESGKMYVLDINPRPWGSVSMLTKKCSGKGVFFPNPEPKTKVCWRFPVKELMSFGNKNNVDYSICRKMKKAAKYETMVDIWDLKDMKPFLMQPVIMLKKLIKRI